jgi:hypothetical protein
MARETIYENPNVAFSGGEGMVTNLLLIPSETYQIVWDDVEYTSTATEVPFDGMTVVAIGDLGIALGAPTGEYPFLIGALPDGSLGYAFTTESGVTSHSLVIYREVEVSGTGIVLKDRDGNPVTHYPTGGVRLPMSDGSTSLFVNADDLPEAVSVTVNPDFTGDKDMTVVPETGTQFSEVIVKKPENLISDYIKDGIEIAGIKGAFQGSGGSVKVAWGILPKPASSSTNQTFTHNLGVVPDFILVETISAPVYGNMTSTSYPHNIVAFSKALGGVLGTTKYQRYLKRYSTSGSQLSRYYISSDFPITFGAVNTAGIICMANETSFKTVGLNAESTYFWIAVAGLT